MATPAKTSTKKDDAPAAVATVVTFTMSDQSYRFDAHPAQLSGREALLIEEVAGLHYPEWLQRIGNGDITPRDLLLLAYLAARRDNELLQWSSFIEHVKPYSLANVQVSVADD